MHPEKVPGVIVREKKAMTKKPLINTKNTKSQGRLMPPKQKDNEQAILDACWSGTAMNDKLKNKLLERMERNKKSRQFRAPSLATRTKTPAQQNSAIKSTKNKLVLMVQESSHHKLPLPKVTSCKHKDQPFVNRFAPSPSIPEPKVKGRPSLDPVSRSLQDGFPSGSQKGMRRDASAYLTLRDQLSKLTMEIQGNNCSIDDSVNSKKQRRTRKERKKGQFDRDSSMVMDSGTLEKSVLNNTQDVNKMSRGRLNKVPSGKIGLKRPLPGHKQNDAAKENTKPNQTSSSKLIITKKPDSNKHLARKYLGELYAKIIFKVKEIEKNSKPNPPQKQTLVKCPSAKQDLRKLSHSKQPNFRYNKGYAAK